MRVAFAGTPEFARAALHALHDAGHAVVLVLTQPDRPSGRGMRLQPSPVKQLATTLALPLAQPRGLRLDGRYADDAAAARAALEAAAPEVMVVAAYGLILPRWVLELPRLGCINIHASLLPRWRGAAPIQRAIEAGDGETGITVMQMDTGLDTGAMLATERTPIGLDETATTLTARLATIGARLIVRTLDALDAGLQATPQPATGITYASKIDKAEAVIDWSRTAAELERRLRALDPFPGATMRLREEIVKVWRGRVVPGQGEPGQLLPDAQGRLVVACGRDALELLELQRPGGRRQPVREFLQHLRAAPG